MKKTFILSLCLCFSLIFLWTTESDAMNYVERSPIQSNAAENDESISDSLAYRTEHLTTTLSQVSVDLPMASLFYDINRDGVKEYANCTANPHKLMLGLGYTSNYQIQNVQEFSSSVYSAGISLFSIDFMDDDTIIDYYFLARQYRGSILSHLDSGSYYDGYEGDSRVFIPGMDLNQDGRVDYISYNNSYSSPYYYIHYQMNNGEYNRVPISIYTASEYQNSFNPDSWTIPAGSNTGLVGTYGGGLGGIFGGFSGAKMPKKSPSVAKANDISFQNGYITKCVDMNGDGLMDLVNQHDGIIYYNMGNNNFVISNAGGSVLTRDLNGDGISDFIIRTGTELVTEIYQGGGEFEEMLLLENFDVDEEIYCYDFDNDGDLDIMVTLGYHSTTTGSYIVFFENDGQGTFTQSPEVIFSQPLYFQNCQDINGDGYMDVLAYSNVVNVSNTSFASGKKTYTIDKDSVYIVAIYGASQLQMSSNLDTLLRFEVLPNYGLLQRTIKDYDVDNMRINAEDLDNDGLTEVWVSGIKYRTSSGDSITTIYKPQNGVINRAPVAPTSLTYNYDVANGTITLYWNSGTDSLQTATDLTYALRVGTASGKDDIIRSDANVDGRRRNYLDGNMGYAQSYTLDMKSYPRGTYYVAVQSIDRQHSGSTWSTEVVFEHSYLPVDFTVNETMIPYTDTLQLFYVGNDSSVTYMWDFAGGVVVDSIENRFSLLYSASGEKEIILQVTDVSGNTMRKSLVITVLPNGFEHEQIVSSDNLTYSSYYYPADYNGDGYLDYASSDGVYKNNGDGTFTKAAGLWNTGLSFYRWLWTDWNRDGLVDLIYTGGVGATSGYLQNNGNGTFTKRTDATAESYTTYYYDEPNGLENLDWNNDGLIDPCNSTHIYKNNGDGTFTLSYSAQGTSLTYNLIMDLNGDGYLDYMTKQYSSPNVVGMTFYINQGDFTFISQNVPFAQTMDQSYLNIKSAADMNNDGYIDILFTRSSADKGFYILWNEQNAGFSSPEYIDVDVFSHEDWFRVYDYDNNGYLDVMLKANIANINSNFLGYYIVYFDENGASDQGYVSESVGVYHLMDKTGNGLPEIYIDEKEEYNNGNYSYSYRTPFVSSSSQSAPNAPTGVKVIQTATGLTISWDAAIDDATPAEQMRYNLSVKLKNQSGANSYIISPFNKNQSYLAIPKTRVYDYDQLAGKSYVTAQQYIIPNSALTMGSELEVSVQAIDLWQAVSEFSDTVDFMVQANSAISAPTETCQNNSVSVSFSGVQSGSTPSWDFDGGTILSGSGYGPYLIEWSSVGTKRISLTLDNTTSYANVLVTAAIDATCEIPSYIQYNTATEFGLPNVSNRATFSWQIQYDNETSWSNLGSGAVINAVPGQRQGTIVVKKSPEPTTCRLQLTVSYNGCSDIYTTNDITLLTDASKPSIVYVSPNGSNHHVITWDASVTPQGATKIGILKEGTSYNSFYLLDTVAISSGSYTDMSSNSTIQSERYVVQYYYGAIPGLKSDIHKTVHLTINRGTSNTQWNLIWNGYEGAQVSSYYLLRGTTPTSLSRISTLSGSNNSYTDNNASSGDTYYAIEYEIYNPNYASSHQQRVLMNVTGRSNVALSSQAGTAINVSSLHIMSVTGDTTTTVDRQALCLYTEVRPLNATYQSVRWEILSGNTLATINQNGLLTALPGNPGGVVTVKATSNDVAAVSTTRQFIIGAIPVVSTTVLCNSITVTTQSGATTLSASQPSLQCVASVLPLNATNTEVSWSIITGASAGTISDNGYLTISDFSQARVIMVRATATDGSGVYGDLTLNVQPNVTTVLCTSITVTTQNGATTLSTSQPSVQCVASVLPLNATNTEVSWSIITGAPAGTISDNGYLTIFDFSLPRLIMVRATATDGSGVYGDVYLNVEQTLTDVESIGFTEPLVWSQNQSLVIQKEFAADIRVFDAIGRMVYQEINNEADKVSIPLTQGVYLVKIGHYTTKIIVTD